MNPIDLQIVPCTPEHGPAIRAILQAIGWDEHYIVSFETMTVTFSRDPERLGGYFAFRHETPVGFVFVELHIWNMLAQVQGLAVHPGYHRLGIATQLVQLAERFAIAKRARGIYVDTPVDNMRGRSFYEAIGYRLGYVMPRYYEDTLDGVTYQKFFDSGI